MDLAAFLFVSSGGPGVVSLGFRVLMARVSGVSTAALIATFSVPLLRGPGCCTLLSLLAERTEAQAVAQSAPVLLTLDTHTPGDGLLHLLPTAQQDVHQLHVRSAIKKETHVE